jgi:hypothetical protein
MIKNNIKLVFKCLFLAYILAFIGLGIGYIVAFAIMKSPTTLWFIIMPILIAGMLFSGHKMIYGE